MNPLVSVIVVTYNQEHTIGRTLSSILAQKCSFNFEIVIGDDDSTDATRKVCEQFALQHPNIVRLMDKAPNKGVVDNYFDCLMATRGKYIADCAGDDFWIDDYKLEKEAAIMEHNDKVVLVHTGWNYYDEKSATAKKNTYTPFPSPVTEGKKMVETIITQTSSPVVHLCTALYRASTIKGLYADHHEFFHGRELGCEDLQIAAMLAAAGDIAYLPEATLNYSCSEASVSRQNLGIDGERKQFVFVRRTADLSFRLAHFYHIDTAATRQFFETKTFALLMHAFRSHDGRLFNEALKYKTKWHVARTPRIRITSFVMSHAPLWHLMLTARNAYVALKVHAQAH